MPKLTLGQIAVVVGSFTPREPERKISGLATLEEAGENEVSFLGAETYLPEFEKTKAAAVIVNRKLRLPVGKGPAVLLVDDADLAVGKVLDLFAPPVPRPPVGVDP